MISNPRLPVVATLVGLMISACGDKTSSNTTDPKCESAASGCKVAITLSPGPRTYTNGGIWIKVEVTPPEHAPEAIQLSKNGRTWITLRPPFQYVWNTASDREDTYQIVAEAIVSGVAVASNPISIVVDRTAPTVQLTPANGATNVSLSDPITLTFSEPIDPASVSSNAITIKQTDRNVVYPTASTLSADNRTLSLTILDRSSFETIYVEGVYDGGIRDRAGNAVIVRSWYWTAPFWVRLPSLAGHAPSLAMGPDGNPTVSFLKSQTGDGPIGIARYAPGSTWASSFSAPSPEAATSTVVAVDGTGNAVLAWSAKDNHVYAAQQGGSSWQVLGTAADTELASGTLSVTSIALDAQGGPIIGIRDIRDKAGVAGTPGGYVVRWVATQWQPLPPIGYQFGASPGPLVSLDSTGAIVAWVDGTVQTYLGSQWYEKFVGFGFHLPTLALDEKDRLLLATETNTGTSYVLSVDSYVGGMWQGVGSSVTESATPFSEAHLATSAGRNPVIVWPWSPGHGQVLQLARYTEQGWVSNFGTLYGSNYDQGTAAHAQVLLDAQGSPTVAWDEYDSETRLTSVYVWKGNF